jgi:high-affinity nickel-transport protein
VIAADVASKTLGLGVLASAFFFGFRHGIDWDHIAAITDITSTQDSKGKSMLYGTLYALGHASVVFVIGSVAILIGQRLPSSIDSVMQRIVGFTLIVLGVYVFVGLARHGREFRMRSRWMLIFSSVRNTYRKLRPRKPSEEQSHELEPVHMHAPGDEGGIALDVADDLPVSEWHHGHHGHPGHHHHKHPEPGDDAFMNYGRATAFVVGMVHGIGAETPTQLLIFLTAAGTAGKAAGELVLGAFLIGLLVSNSIITLGSALGFLRASQNWRVYAGVAVLTATFSLVIGCLFFFGKATLLPALFGG